MSESAEKIDCFYNNFNFKCTVVYIERLKILISDKVLFD